MIKIPGSQSNLLPVRRNGHSKLMFFIFVALLLFIACLEASTSVFAEEYNPVVSSDSHSNASYNQPVTVDIPLEYVISNEAKMKKNVKCTFTLKAASEETPMPDGKYGGQKEVVMTKSGKTHFGKIKYTTPDVYAYTVVRKNITTVDGLKEDNAEFNVFVCALNNGEGSIIIKRAGDNGKSELIYADTFKSKSQNQKKSIIGVMTGDSTKSLLFICALFSIFLVFLWITFMLLIVKPYNKRMVALEEELHKRK